MTDQHSVWMEFQSDHLPTQVTSRFSCLTFNGACIEGGDLADRVAALQSGHWITADEHGAFERATAYGALTVLLHTHGGTRWRLRCASVRLQGSDLVVDDRAVASFDAGSGTWARLTDGQGLASIRIEPAATLTWADAASSPASLRPGPGTAGAASPDTSALASAGAAVTEAIARMLALQSALLASLRDEWDDATGAASPRPQQRRRVRAMGDAQRRCLHPLQRLQAVASSEAPLTARCLQRVLSLLLRWQRDTEDELSVQVDGHAFERRMRQVRHAGAVPG